MSKLSYQIVLSQNHDVPVEPCTYYRTRSQAESNIPWLRWQNRQLGELSVIEVDRDAPMEVGHGD